jgi:hypothetical protein
MRVVSGQVGSSYAAMASERGSQNASGFPYRVLQRYTGRASSVHTSLPRSTRQASHIGFPKSERVPLDHAGGGRGLRGRWTTVFKKYVDVRPVFHADINVAYPIRQHTRSLRQPSTLGKNFADLMADSQVITRSERLGWRLLLASSMARHEAYADEKSTRSGMRSCSSFFQSCLVSLRARPISLL